MRTRTSSDVALINSVFAGLLLAAIVALIPTYIRAVGQLWRELHPHPYAQTIAALIGAALIAGPPYLLVWRPLIRRSRTEPTFLWRIKRPAIACTKIHLHSFRLLVTDLDTCLWCHRDLMDLVHDEDQNKDYTAPADHS